MMWPGFDVRLTAREAGLFLNIESCFKVVRLETGLEVIKRVFEMSETRGSDYRKEVSKEFEKAVVVTSYNMKSYFVSGISFDTTPTSSFLGADGVEITFVDYYFKRY
jgi:hypothetical protein